MELKDVVTMVSEKVKEAENAHRAGHPDVARNYLAEIRTDIQSFFEELEPYAGNAEESATSEKTEETIEETQAKVSGPGVQPAVIDPAQAAQPGQFGSAGSKPIQ